MPQAERDNILKELEELKQAIKDKSLDRMKSGMESLTKASHKLAEEMYKATQAQPGQGQQGAQGQTGPEGNAGPQQEEGPSQQAGGKDDVIDADFKAHDDK